MNCVNLWTMSNIEKLLKGVEVEWKTLGEIAEIGTGSHDTQDAVEDGNYIFYARGREPLRLNMFDFDEIAIITAGDGVGVGKVFHYAKGKYALHQRAYRIAPRKRINPRFVYHYISANFYAYVQKTSVNSSVSSLRRPMFLKFPIPIPSFEMQTEIVRILDKFSTLTAELQAELQARKSQYEYYRNQLLTYPMEESDQPSLRSSRSATSIQNSDNPTQPLSTPNPHTGNSVLQPHNKVEWKTLGKIAEYSHKRINAATIMKTNYVGVDNLLQNKAGKTESNYVPTEGNLTAYTVGDILIGNIRPYLKKIWLADNNGGTNGDVLVIHLTDKSVDTRYLYQVLADDNFFVYNMQYAKGAKMPRGNKQKIMEYQIPIPYPNDIKKSLEEQERIASILDKFNKITTSITEGLPKEIELRQKQYEYYRDMLLTFPTDNIKA